MAAPLVLIGVGIAGYPRHAAGNTWAFLNWCLGFRELGWRVHIAEDVPADKLEDAAGRKGVPAAASANLGHWRRTLGHFGLLADSTLKLGDHLEAPGTDGPADARERLLDAAREAAFFLNISGHYHDAEVLRACRRRVYLDLDPLFTQVWHEAYNAEMNLAAHDAFFSVGTRLGKPDCPAPSAGRHWLPTFPPVASPWLRDEGTASPPGAPFTTVTHWHGYPAIEWQGAWYGNKSEEFRRLAQLPSEVPCSLEIATNLHADDPDRAAMLAGGWRLADGPAICADFASYEGYLLGSAGEFSAAKNGYVQSRCGWFSDRSVCYLALGRPVVLQDCGWAETLGRPADPASAEARGLLGFRSPAEAATALRRITEDPTPHRQAARELAREHFAAAKVAARLAEAVA